MTEEQVTLAILEWLEMAGWRIICYDFPQSGTGIPLHPKSELRFSKKGGAIIPDIVAIRNGIAVFFENKDRFVLSDVRKINRLRTTNDYSYSISRLFEGCRMETIFYGIGLPLSDVNKSKCLNQKTQIDFAVFVDQAAGISIGFEAFSIF